MTWESDVREIIEGNWRRGSTFTLRELYAVGRHLKKRHPENRHVEEKIRQTLQRLRDLRLIDFIDQNGTYRRVK